MTSPQRRWDLAVVEQGEVYLEVVEDWKASDGDSMEESTRVG
jgi:hypothetical protein